MSTSSFCGAGGPLKGKRVAFLAVAFCGRNLETCPVTMAPIGDSGLFTLLRPVQSPHLVMQAQLPVSVFFNPVAQELDPSLRFVTLLSLPLAPRLPVNYVAQGNGT